MRSLSIPFTVCESKKGYKVSFKNKTDYTTYNIDVKPASVDNYYGFTISGNHRFLLGDFTVTHNTVIALKIACKLKLKTLVIVHKTNLQDQWIERIQQFTSASIGTIRQKHVDIEKDIVIGMLQSISQRDYDKKIFKKFGLVIVDECHHIAAKVFSRALRKTCCQHILGLSATLQRKDGLTRVLHWYMGKTLYKESRQSNTKVAVREFVYMSTDHLFKEKKRWIKGSIRPDTVKMTGILCELCNRNTFIIKILQVLYKIPHRKILVLSHRRSHVQTLSCAINKIIRNEEESGKTEQNEYTTGFFMGRMKKEDLKKSEDADIIFGTYDMAEEGLDIPDLNAIILASPKKDIEQAVGRILRKRIKDMLVVPLIIDIRDKLSVFEKWGKNRHNFYQNTKYNIQMNYVKNKSLISKRDYYESVLGDDLSSCTSDEIPELIDILNINENGLKEDCLMEDKKEEKIDVGEYLF